VTTGSASPPAGRGQSLRAAALLVAAICLLHYDVVFLGRSLVHTNYFNPLDQRPLAQNYGDRLVPQEEWTARNLWLIANVRDPATSFWQWEPSTQFFKEAISKGEWPFWDPYIGGGTPAMANLLPAFFFPPYAIVVGLGASVGLRNAYFLFTLWSAAFLTYVFLRRHGLGFGPSVGGGTMIVMSGAMNQYLGSIAGQVLACLPLALVATRWLLDRPTRLRAAGLTLIYAGIALASLPPLLVAVFSTAAIYAAVAIARGDCGATRQRAAVAWAGAASLAMGLVAAYFLPAVALSRSVPQAAEIYRGAGLESMPIVNLLQLLSPTLMGGVQVYLTAPYASNGYAAHIPYVGVVCLVLALLARPDGQRRERTLLVFSIAAAVLVLLKLFGIPPVHWIGSLPVLDHVHFAHYFGVLLGFLVAFLGALGLERILDGMVTRRRFVCSAVVAAAGVATFGAIAWRDGAFSQLGAGYWIRDWAVLGTIAISAIVLLALCARQADRPRRRAAFAMCLVGLLSIEGAYNDFHPKPAAWDMFEHPLPFLRLMRLEAPMGRVLGFGIPPANVNSAFRVFGLNSLMTFTPPRIYQLYRHYGASPVHVFMTLPAQVPPEPVLDHAHVRFLGAYAVIPADVQRIEARGYGKKFDDGYAVVFERETLPRYFYSSEYRRVGTDLALQAIATTRPKEIVVEEEPAPPVAPNAASDPDVTLRRFRFNSIALEVDAPRPGLVYASEAFFDGWSATVNGRPARILAANYAFRAVEVPAGRVVIEFRYWPPGLTTGLWISAMTGLVLLAATLAPSRRARTLPVTGDQPPASPFPAGT
jgi:hypothetical protein